MSYNHIDRDIKSCNSDEDWSKCNSNHPKPQKLLLECGEGTGSKIFTSSNDESFQLAHVTLDTTCINKPEVLIKFSSLVNMERIDEPATVRLKYELFRVCGKEEPICLGIWNFEEVNVVDDDFDRQEESFGFIFCECTNCPRCCEYFVTVTPLEITNARSIVSNGRMAALSQSMYDSFSEKHKTCHLKYEDVKLKQNHHIPTKILLACGQGNGSVIFREEPETEPSAGIAHVAVDLSCLRKSKVLIEFSSIIKIDRDVNDMCLQFELFRVCGDGEPVSRGIWTFERTGVGDEIDLDKAFDFIFCEVDVPSSCCQYFVTVTPIEIVTQNDEVDVVVDNARITALAQSLQDSLDPNSFKELDEKDCCIDCISNDYKEKEIILECGSSNGSRIFTSSNDSACQLSHVTINTTCLCSPIVNIEFSSIVSFVGLRFPSSDARLRYELFRVCDKRRPISLGVWMSERIIIPDTAKTTNAFNFTFCDCTTCPGCCYYFVKVTPIRIAGAIVTVSNGRMAALAGEIKQND